MEGFPNESDGFKPRQDMPSIDDRTREAREGVPKPQDQPQADEDAELEFPPTIRQMLDDDFLNMYGREE